MRLRFNKNAKNILINSQDYFIDVTNQTQIDPSKWFIIPKNPIHLEIGAGKGNFIIQNAINNPNTNFIALEKNETILAKAINKTKSLNLNNLKFINYDANKINELFISNCIAKIFLNFSDPWPKARHAKRRLTHPTFLVKYKDILVNNGIIEFKTDNDSLYNYTYEVLNDNLDNFNLIYFTTDLYQHLDEYNNKFNIPTEYEQKFHQLNKNIYKIVFNFK